MAELTPMKKQYNEIKEKHRDCLLFFRLGDFYEMFGDDAVKASEELDIVLTTRDKSENPEERTPMCGVPYHSAEAYIARLVSKGYKVAICEQTEDPANAKGLVSREVTHVITPGTVTSSVMLDENRANYICSVYLDSGSGALCFCDVSTGEFRAASYSDDPVRHILNELSAYNPAEAVLGGGALDNDEIMTFLTNSIGCRTEPGGERFDFMQGAARVCEQFGAKSLDELGLGENTAAVCASGGLLSYLTDTQKRDLSHINKLEMPGLGEFMELDYTTRRSLELTANSRTGEKKGSLLWVIDKTKTSMGSRLLRSWTERPLLSPAGIKRRQASVAELYSDNVTRTELMLSLREIGDIVRIGGKAVYASANARDLISLVNSLSNLPRITELLAGKQSAMLREIREMDTLGDMADTISSRICEEPPFSVREGGIFRAGFSEELDRLRDIRDNGARMMAELEQGERERTGIKKLKIGYNKVFGYYIDIPRSVSQDVPENYIRKQTLVSNERYFTQELKELENSLLTAKDRIAEIEYEQFMLLLGEIAGQVTRIQRCADLIARLDALCSLAEAAVRNGYECPEVDMSMTLSIRDGRHPVVELTQKDTLFVPNDTFLNDGSDRVAIVTGPNMAGKSTYMRQTALIVLMAQMGSFVPAREAVIGIVDRVFTRIGASDDLAAGQSTFMVEMTETASILKSAGKRSLLILDEIGRGTSTYDGMAIARAVLEYCADKRRLGAKTMFATHYHELTALESEIEGVRNYNITAKKQGGKLTFLRKIVPGAADDSYGIEVAGLAGVPDSVIQAAKKHLQALEMRSEGAVEKSVAPSDGDIQLSLTHVGADEVGERLKNINLDTLTPLEALNLLYELKKKVGLL